MPCGQCVRYIDGTLVSQVQHILITFRDRLLWGVILFMHVVCNNWAKLMVVRFFLGMAEAM